MSGLTEANVGKVLEWAYEKAVNGIPGTDTAHQLAESYLSKSANVDDAINSLIKWQITKCATSGFLTGLGGVITMPVTIPANIASVLYVQIRMVAAIAHMKGYDLKDDQVQTFVFACLTGQTVNEVVKGTGIKIGVSIGKVQIRRIPGEVIKKINKAVGFRLVTKFGQKGAVNLGKMVPLIGGVIGGSFDAVSTKAIAHAAKKSFETGGYNNGEIIIDMK